VPIKSPTKIIPSADADVVITLVEELNVFS
jgi:hypothetical protein